MSRKGLSQDRRKQLRYAAASAASLAVAQAVLVATFGVAGWSPVPSNVASFAVATVFAYVVQRRWTWRRSGRSSFRREVFPFWSIAALGLLASTVAVRSASTLAGEHLASRAGQTIAVIAASTAAYGILWVLKFLAFDRLLFVERTERAP
jgi:putative flippase GtrA